MSGNKLFIDTNIVVYLLSGDKTLAGLLHQKQLYLSFITQLELLGYQGITPKEQRQIETFLKNCVILDINASIKLEVINLRQNYSLKLPDSIIMASSIYLDMPIITSDIDYKKVEEINLMYYER